MDLPNLDPLNVPQLQDLIARAQRRIAELMETGRAELIDKMQREAHALGFDDLESMLATTRGKRGRGRPRATNGHADQHQE